MDPILSINNIIALAVTGCIGLLLVVMAVFLLRGKGAWMIAGYNTSSPAEKAQVDQKALCRFVGKILLPIGLCTPLVAVGGIFRLAWLNWLYLAGVVGLSVFAVIYCNTGNRFKK